MEKKLQIYTLTFFVFTILFSCEKEFPISEIKPPELTANCLFSPNTVWKIKLTNTKSPFKKSGIIPVDNANISIVYYNDNKAKFIRDFYYKGNGIYLSKQKPLLNKSYDLLISCENFDTLRSQSTITCSLEIDTMINKIIINNNRQKVLKTNITMVANSASFIMIRHIVNKKSVSINNDTLEFQDTVWINPECDIFEHVLPESAVNKELFASIGNAGHFELHFESYDGFRKTENLIAGESVFEIYECSKDYFKYQKSKILYKWSNRNNYSSIVNPDGLYVNVKNGLGIFAGYRKIVLKRKFN